MGERPYYRAELSLDQRLIDRLGCLPDPVINLGGLKYLQDFKQCRLVQAIVCLCPSARTIAVVSPTITRWPVLRA
jgi:hypothetical protein